MKKVIVPVLILAVLGVGWYFMRGKSIGPINMGGSESGQAFKGSMLGAAKLGIPMKCSYTVDGEMESVGYIKGKNYRGKMAAEQGQIAEVIMKDNCMWSWDEEKKEGVKFCFDEDMWNFDEADLEDIKMPEGYKPPEMEYDCKPAVITDAQFTPPADVKFVDMTELMNSFAAPQEGFEDMSGEVDMEQLMEQYGQ